MYACMYVRIHVNYFLPFTMYIGQPAPLQFYAINSDGSISNVSFTSTDVGILTPSENVTIDIPLSCNNPLQCIPPQQNRSSSIYIPDENNSGLILLEIQDEVLHAYAITISQCVINDFELIPNHERPLLIACTNTDNTARYVLTNRYGTEDNDIRRAAIGGSGVTAIVSPIILGLPRPIDEGDAKIALINSQNRTATYEVLKLEGDTLPIVPNFPCVPAHLTKHNLNCVFILTCMDGQQYLVNIQSGSAVSSILPSSVTALANNARYSLAIAVFNSTTNVTIQEMMSQPVNTRTVQLNATVIYVTGFSPDDRFAYVATDRNVVFIDVVMIFIADEALNRDGEFMYIVPTQLCSQCPPVAFLNNSTVVISSSARHQAVLLEFYQLLPWPPQRFLNRTLNKQPKWYWFTVSEDIFPPTDSTTNTIDTTISTADTITSTAGIITSTTDVTVSTTDVTASTTDPTVSTVHPTATATDNINSDEGLTGGIIALIVIGIVVFIVIIIVVFGYSCKRTWHNNRCDMNFLTCMKRLEYN